jgi:hypothetical protein
LSKDYRSPSFLQNQRRKIAFPAGPYAGVVELERKSAAVPLLSRDGDLSARAASGWMWITLASGRGCVAAPSLPRDLLLLPPVQPCLARRHIVCRASSGKQWVATSSESPPVYSASVPTYGRASPSSARQFMGLYRASTRLKDTVLVLKITNLGSEQGATTLLKVTGSLPKTRHQINYSWLAHNLHRATSRIFFQTED